MADFIIDLDDDANSSLLKPNAPCDLLEMKQHSFEADELDFICSKMSDIRVRSNNGLDEEVKLCDVSIEQFSQMVQNIMASDAVVKKHSVIMFRKLLAHENIHPHLDKIVESGVVRPVMELLSSEDPEMQFESAWILTNIAAGTSAQTAVVVELGAIPLLITLLSSTAYNEIKEQAIWCLGNIAGDGVKMRHEVLHHGALPPIISVITNQMNEFLASSSYVSQPPIEFPGLVGSSSPRKKNFNLSTLRIAIWALSNFCRGNGTSELDWTMVDIAIPVLSQVLTCCSPPSPHTDDEILTDACWALSRTLRGIHEGIDKIIVDPPTCSRIAVLICHQNPEVQLPALRCLINIVSGGDSQTQIVLDSGLLPYLHQLLVDPPTETVRKEACLIVSNILAGNREQVQAVIDADLFPTLIDILRFGDFKSRREALWAISNATLNRDAKQMKALLECGLMTPLFDFMVFIVSTTGGVLEAKLLMKLLEALKNILLAGDTLAHILHPATPSPSTSTLTHSSTQSTSVFDDKFLDQFQNMTIINPLNEEVGGVSTKEFRAHAPAISESGYSSLADLFSCQGAASADSKSSTSLSPHPKNPFLACFTSPLQIHPNRVRIEGARRSRGLFSTAFDEIKAIVSAMRNDVNSERCAIYLLANEIASTWFSNQLAV